MPTTGAILSDTLSVLMIIERFCLEGERKRVPPVLFIFILKATLFVAARLAKQRPVVLGFLSLLWVSYLALVFQI